MAVISFKCPSCGGYLEFNPNAQDFKCPYCSKSFNQEEILELGENKELEAQKKQPEVFNDELLYNCTNCGAQIVTDETTAATSCYYCHSPIVLANKLSEEYRPDRLIPFKFDKDAALKKFKEYISTKKFVPKQFFENSQLKHLSGVFYPYWDCDYAYDASYEGQGTQVSHTVSGDYNITITRYFKVVRKGKIIFNNIFRNGLKKNQKNLADGIHPFNYEDEKDYNPAYLSGYVAERRDTNIAEIQPSVEEETNKYIEPLLTSDSNYTTLNGKTKAKLLSNKFNYLLLPTWVLTYQGRDDAQYYFSMNGQTGKTCGKLPVDKTKLLIYAIITGAVVSALLILGGLYLW